MRDVGDTAGLPSAAIEGTLFFLVWIVKSVNQIVFWLCMTCFAGVATNNDEYN